MSAWGNSYVRNNVSLHNLGSLKTLFILRWSMSPMQLKGKENPNIRYSVTVARNLDTLQNIVRRKSLIIAKRRAIL